MTYILGRTNLTVIQSACKKSQDNLEQNEDSSENNLENRHKGHLVEETKMPDASVPGINSMQSLLVTSGPAVDDENTKTSESAADDENTSNIGVHSVLAPCLDRLQEMTQVSRI